MLAVDAHDLAFGTSRWSSKLVHGGLRYLATGDVPMVLEGVRERERLRRVAPHVSHRQEGICPHFGSGGSLACPLQTRYEAAPSFLGQRPVSWAL